jgi:uracil-DNA glycosylase
MSETSPLKQLTCIATRIAGIDLDCYNRHSQDPGKAILGLGKATARWCFFGRDPGEHEVRLQKPFVGDAGQRIRGIMAEFGLSDDDVYWMNTVPFKPKGNAAWSVGVRRKCHPALLELFGEWEGTAVITFGEAAFNWFGYGSHENRRSVEQFWSRADKYEAQLPIDLPLAGGERRVTLYPMPHPSRANATWFDRFPELFRVRLRETQTT